MCEPVSFTAHLEATRLLAEAAAANEPRLYTEMLPYPSLSLSVPLEERIAAIDRVRVENIARIERQKDENIAAIDRKYALVDQALAIGGPDATYWLWVVGLAATAGVVHWLRMFL